MDRSYLHIGSYMVHVRSCLDTIRGSLLGMVSRNDTLPCIHEYMLLAYDISQYTVHVDSHSQCRFHRCLCKNADKAANFHKVPDRQRQSWDLDRIRC